MNLTDITHRVVKTIQSHAPEIMSGLAVAGVITTSYLTGKAAYQASKILSEEETIPDDPKEKFKEQTRLTWKLYVPAGIAGTCTVAFIIGAAKASGNKTAAAITAYSLSEKAFTEYREKVIEQVGKNKDQKIRDDIAQEHVSGNPVVSKEVIITGGGDVMCCELYTHRYFKSDMESLRKVENYINQLRLTEMYVTLDELYDEIGLPHTDVSGKIGWNFERPLELNFTTVLAENGEPCLAFTYSYVKPL